MSATTGSDNPFAALWEMTTYGSVEDAAVREIRDEDNDDSPQDIQQNVSAVAAASEIVSGESEAPEAAAVVEVSSVSASVSNVPRRSVSSVAAPSEATLIPEDSMIYTTAPEIVDITGGLLRDGTGVEYELVAAGDAVIIGRSPLHPAGFTGRLWRITSPEKSVSRSHLVVFVSGNAVLARDLGGVNGTSLIRAGETRKIAAGADISLQDGDILMLGHESLITFQAKAGQR